MSLRTALLSAVVVVLVASSTAAFADQQVIVNGTVWTCQHSCVVVTNQFGYSVYDSGGGWIRSRELQMQ